MPSSIFAQPAAHKIFVEELIAARKRSGLNQTEIAARLGKNQQYLSRIESGRRRIDVVEFVSLARAMDFDPAKLFARIVRKLPG